MKPKLMGIAACITAGLTLAASAQPRDDRRDERPATVVEAPTTRVETDADRTRVTVRAPATDVDVDTERREVRIRVPYFDGVIRW